MRYAGDLPRSRYPWKEIPGSSHDVLLSRILALSDGLSVLDVGFGAGHLARRIRPRCRYLAGIELDPEAAREGAAWFDDPLVDDVLHGLSGPWREPFDVIVAGDILEHLPEPDRALALLRPILKPEGLLLVSLPNVANVTVRLGLLAGRFQPADRGILDRTHLRFFTRKTALELVEQTGFEVVRFGRVVEPTATTVLGRAFERWARRGTRSEGRTAALADLVTVQVLLAARRV